MRIRLSLMRKLYGLPYFRGRDRLLCYLAEGFKAQPLELASGLLVDLDLREYVQLEIGVRGCVEPQTLELIASIVEPGACVIDVGAHIGWYALAAARAAGSAGKVFAFDPQPYHADRIGRHALLNGMANIISVCAAVGEADGFIALPMQSERDRARLSLFEPGPNDLGVLVEVPLRRLDTFLSAHSIHWVNLLKIDVEGYELEVLRGLGQAIASCKNIVLEMLDATPAARNRDVVDHLTGAGFELKDVSGMRWQWGMPLKESNLWAHRS